MPAALAHVSPKTAAEALGASESSLKRWIDSGLLTVERTAGGHRRIPVAEVIRFARAQGLHVRQPPLLGLPPNLRYESTVAGSLDEALHEALAAGADQTVRELLLGAFLGGHSVAHLGDGPIRQSLQRIGERWQHAGDGVAIEHRATAICVRTVERLRALLPLPGADAPVAVGSALAGDPYLLPTALVATVLTECGYRAIDLGPNTPGSAIIHACAWQPTALCWQSVSSEIDPQAVVRDLRSLSAAIAPVPLIVGGRRLSELQNAGLTRAPETLHAMRTMSELAAFAQGLRHHPPVGA